MTAFYQEHFSLANDFHRAQQRLHRPQHDVIAKHALAVNLQHLDRTFNSDPHSAHRWRESPHPTLRHASRNRLPTSERFENDDSNRLKIIKSFQDPDAARDRTESIDP